MSMDGKGWATDNAFIERSFGHLKRKHIYLNPASYGLELYLGVIKFIEKYNRRYHQVINRQKPINLYQQASLTNFSRGIDGRTNGEKNTYL